MIILVIIIMMTVVEDRIRMQDSTNTLILLVVGRIGVGKIFGIGV